MGTRKEAMWLRASVKPEGLAGPDPEGHCSHDKESVPIRQCLRSRPSSSLSCSLRICKGSGLGLLGSNLTLGLCLG